MSLSLYRQEIEKWNRDFFALLQTRKVWVEKIQEEKKKVHFNIQDSSFVLFDPAREFQLFHSIQDSFRTVSLKEILSFSLIMEVHILSLYPGTYPAWSERIHILKRKPKAPLVEMINPLLLYFYSPGELNKISLTQSFQKILQEATGEQDWTD